MGQRKKIRKVNNFVHLVGLFLSVIRSYRSNHLYNAIYNGGGLDNYRDITNKPIVAYYKDGKIFKAYDPYSNGLNF